MGHGTLSRVSYRSPSTNWFSERRFPYGKEKGTTIAGAVFARVVFDDSNSGVYAEDSDIESSFKTLKPAESRQWVDENPWSSKIPSIDPSSIPSRLKPLIPFLEKYFGKGGSTDVLEIFESKKTYQRFCKEISLEAREELNAWKPLVLKLQKRQVATMWINEVDLESEEDGPISIEKEKMLYLLAFLEKLNRLGFFADEKIAEGSFLEWDDIRLE